MNHPLKGEIGPTGRAGMDGHRGEKGETGLYLHNKYLFLPAVYTLFLYTFNSIDSYICSTLSVLQTQQILSIQ